MNDISNNNNIKNAQIQNNENNISLKKNFSTESEIIINYIIEKIISFTITEALKNKIDKQIPNFCFNKLHEALNMLNQMEFITYEKDDLFPIQKIYLKKINSAKNLNNSIYSVIPSRHEELSNSEIIRKYKFDRIYDVNVSNDISINLSLLDHSEKEEKEENDEIDNEKVILGILNREGYEDKNNSFQEETIKKEKLINKYNKKTNYNFSENKKEIIKEINNGIESTNVPFLIGPEEKIDEIKNVEIHKLEIPKNKLINNINKRNNKKSIPLEKVIGSKNNWKPILQPNSPPIDRDAGSKIKYAKPKIKLIKKIISKQIPDKDNNNNNDNNDNNKKILDKHLSEKNIEIIQKRKKKKITNIIKNAQDNKKKKIVLIPFESADIEPKELESYKELEEIANLRFSLEKTIQEKKKEKDLLVKLEKEKKNKMQALEEMRKELFRKNVTVDVKGEIVYIKPVDMRELKQEFNNSKANFKNIKILETEPKYINEKSAIKVEKNPLANIEPEYKEEKNKKNKKKKIGFYLLSKSTNTNNNIFIRDTNKKKSLIDKNTKYISGSNFGIINPEIGVNVIENKAVKSGGKDFYKKYNRFSIEDFQEQLSKTSKNFFPKLTDINVININTNENNNRRNSFNLKEKINKILEYKDKGKNVNLNIKNKNNEKSSLSLKTKNLKIALQDLDLITEREITDLNKNKKFIKTNFLQKILDNSNTQKSKKNLNDINKFNKTLMSKDNWGIDTYTDRKSYKNYRIPKKPESIDIKRELPNNMLNHMPRKRLPPINTSIKMNTLSNFHINKKPKKIKVLKTEDKKE